MLAYCYLTQGVHGDFNRKNLSICTKNDYERKIFLYPVGAESRELYLYLCQNILFTLIQLR